MVIGKVTRVHGYERLKKEQLSAFEKFVSGKDVFVVLTGFGIPYVGTSTHSV